MDIKAGGIFVERSVIREAIEQAKNLPRGKHVIFEKENFDQRIFPGTIVADIEIWNDVELHVHEADFWVCLHGEARFVYGGNMIEPYQKPGNDKEAFAKEIKDGTETILRSGDVLYIPAGQPHQHGSNGLAILGIIKIPDVKHWNDTIQV